MTQRETEYRRDVDSWVATLFAIEDPELFREKFLVILGDCGAKYGGTPGIIWKTIPPHIDERESKGKVRAGHDREGA